MKIITAVVVGLMLVGSTQAATITFSGANPQQTSGLAGFSTFGDMMDGMDVTANGIETVQWATTGVGAGAAVGTGWSLSEAGDTWFESWTLSSDAGLDSLLIDAGTGDTIFDITWRDNTVADPGTVGSGGGWTFETSSDVPMTVTYSGPVSLTGESAVGDLYRYMLIEFDTTFQGELTFRADTDNCAEPGDITPTIPAPGAVVLATLGTGLVGWFRRRRMA